METIATDGRDATFMESQGSAYDTTCFDHNLVRGALVG